MVHKVETRKITEHVTLYTTKTVINKKHLQQQQKTKLGAKSLEVSYA